METEAIELLRALDTGRWAAVAAAVISLLVSQMKRPAAGALVKRIPKRWRPVVPLALGAAAGVLYAVAGGSTWRDAVVLGLLSGPGAIGLYEILIYMMLDKPRSAP